MHEFFRKLVVSEDAATAQSADAIIGRFAARLPFSMLDELRVEPGTMADYRGLSSFHYRGGQPGAVTSVLRIAHRTRSVMGRYLSRPAIDVTAGVLVRSLPALGCELRGVATRNRYNGLARRDAATMLNAEVRTISRVVIDPRYRGLGLAVNLVRHALDHPERESMRFTEALAAMGRVSPFFERSGMKRYDRPPQPRDARLLDALAHLAIEPATLACGSMIKLKLARLTVSERMLLLQELMRWARGRMRRGAIAADDCSLDELLRAARDALLSQPVYYIFAHR